MCHHFNWSCSSIQYFSMFKCSSLWQTSCATWQLIIILSFQHFQLMNTSIVRYYKLVLSSYQLSNCSSSTCFQDVHIVDYMSKKQLICWSIETLKCCKLKALQLNPIVNSTFHPSTFQLSNLYFSTFHYSQAWGVGVFSSFPLVSLGPLLGTLRPLYLAGFSWALLCVPLGLPRLLCIAPRSTSVPWVPRACCYGRPLPRALYHGGLPPALCDNRKQAPIIKCSGKGPPIIKCSGKVCVAEFPI